MARLFACLFGPDIHPANSSYRNSSSCRSSSRVCRPPASLLAPLPPPRRPCVSGWPRTAGPPTSASSWWRGTWCCRQALTARCCRGASSGRQSGWACPWPQIGTQPWPARNKRPPGVARTQPLGPCLLQQAGAGFLSCSFHVLVLLMMMVGCQCHTRGSSAQAGEADCGWVCSSGDVLLRRGPALLCRQVHDSPWMRWCFAGRSICRQEWIESHCSCGCWSLAGVSMRPCAQLCCVITGLLSCGANSLRKSLL